MDEYIGPERRDTMLQDEVRELREATATLSHRVESLSDSFKQVNALTASQQEVDKRSAAAVYEAAMAISKVKELDEVVVPREEHERRWRAEQEELIALRLRIKRRSFWQSFGFFLAGMVVLGVTVGVVHHQQQSQHAQTVRACRDRVNVNKRSVVAYEQLVKTRTVQSDPVLKKFFEAAREGARQGSLIVC